MFCGFSTTYFAQDILTCGQIANAALAPSLSFYYVWVGYRLIRKPLGRLMRGGMVR